MIPLTCSPLLFAPAAVNAVGIFGSINRLALLPTFPKKSKKASSIAASTNDDLLMGKSFLSVEEALEAKKALGSKSLKFVDGSWWLGKSRDARAEFEAGPRIEGAIFFDIDDVASKGDSNSKGLPHMAPSKELFAAAMDAMGITNSQHIVVYGAEGCMFVHRAYYTFRALGHDNDKVHMMEGSLKEWEDKGGPVDTTPTKTIDASSLDLSATTSYQASDAIGFVAMDRVQEVVKEGGKGDAIVLDARSGGRFSGRDPEPRPELSSGHMPGSYNVPFFDLLQGPEGDWTKLKSKSELKDIFAKAEVDIQSEQQIICSCGSGVTAAAIAAALQKCGRDMSSVSVFDGSWIEWASEPENPILKDVTVPE